MLLSACGTAPCHAGAEGSRFTFAPGQDRGSLAVYHLEKALCSRTRFAVSHPVHTQDRHSKAVSNGGKLRQGWEVSEALTHGHFPVHCILKKPSDRAPTTFTLTQMCQQFKLAFNLDCSSAFSLVPGQPLGRCCLSAHPWVLGSACSLL